MVNTSSSGPEPGEDLADEFRELGRNLKNVFHSAWESAERKNLQQEIESGLDELGKSLKQAATEFKDSPAGERLREDARDLEERIRSGEVEQKVRSDLGSALRQVNEELKKFLSKAGPPADQPPQNN